MSNPFDDRSEEERSKEEGKKKMIGDAEAKYGDLILGVLRQFGKVVDPGYRVARSGFYEHYAWAVQRKIYSGRRVIGHKDLIGVRLEPSETNQTIVSFYVNYFDAGESRPIAELNEENLIAILKKLRIKYREMRKG